MIRQEWTGTKSANSDGSSGLGRRYAPFVGRACRLEVNGVMLRAFGRAFSLRAIFSLSHDSLMGAVAINLSLWLRLGWEGYSAILPDVGAPATIVMIVVVAIASVISRSNRTSWRYFSIPDVIAMVRMVTLALLMFLPASFLLWRAESIPRATYVVMWLVLFLLVAGPRVAYRLSREGRLTLRPRPAGVSQIPVLLIGAGNEAEAFLRGLAPSREVMYRPVGIIDENGWRRGGTLHGVPILGDLKALPKIMEMLARGGETPRKLVVTDLHAPPEMLGHLLQLAEGLGLTLARVPRSTELQPGLEQRDAIKPVALEDLLGRSQAVLDPSLPASVIADKCVLVTGAGGSIGSELARQIAAFGPRRLVLLDSSEFNLYSIDMEISERNPTLSRAACLADVRDRPRILRVMEQERPDIVFHAAALKHVPMVEAHPVEGLLTNVIGTRNVADAAVAAGASEFVLISTDKAVNATNVMGATKRCAELYCQAMDVEGLDKPNGTRFAMVRFGNVLGSAGSVVPLFQRQLAAGGPITVTHPDVKRFFMTIPEAVALLLQASGLSGSRRLPAGSIMVLDMGEPVKIVDLARQMIRLAGLRPDVDVKIDFVGLRPGEKLFEELFFADETLNPTAVPGVRLVEPNRMDYREITSHIVALERACASGDEVGAVAGLAKIVPALGEREAGGTDIRVVAAKA